MTTTIEWTNRTWNPLRGCSRVSEGCRHCYAEAIAARFSQPGNTFHGFAERTADGPRWTGAVTLLKDKLPEPFTWKKPQRVFVNSMSDLFHEALPDEAIDKVFAVMALTPQHTYQVLTKRAERMLAYFRSFDGPTAFDRGFNLCAWAGGLREGLTPREVAGPIEQIQRGLPNVWLGVSVEDQAMADARVPLLLETAAAVRFISAEPLLGPVNLAPWLFRQCADCGIAAAACAGLRRMNRACCPDCRHRRIDWVIPGGESGAGARESYVAWVRSLVEQCGVAGVACFVKQLGANVRDRNDAGFEGDTPGSWPMDSNVIDNPNGYREEYQGAPVRIRLRKKGGDPAEWPEDLRVREFPAVSA
jgi:protein gp37